MHEVGSSPTTDYVCNDAVLKTAFRPRRDDTAVGATFAPADWSELQGFLRQRPNPRVVFVPGLTGARVISGPNKAGCGARPLAELEMHETLQIVELGVVALQAHGSLECGQGVLEPALPKSVARDCIVIIRVALLVTAYTRAVGFRELLVAERRLQTRKIRQCRC